MISKRKQKFELDVKFVPELVKLRRTKPFKQTDHFSRDISLTLKNDTMGFGEKITCEFVPVKDFQEVQQRLSELRAFAKKLKKNKCFEPTAVIILDDKDMYYAGLMAGDAGK